ncbi:gpcrRhopsn4 domain-containing protein [Caerostris extrusa]|uniref:GpcrRhopsn4 domain-containing protein n=1 Tax=Caerostris extrusa TaxID=172846 RepID=A0AAV4TZ45_CAEEX|nr:gpcrRhopsn4 domain-containing protein [Caerostris extrusa]
MLDENDRAKLRFYVHFGAGILVWFVYLPVVALIALQISALWRAKLLLGITSSADFLAYAIMAHLLWPTRSESSISKLLPNLIPVRNWKNLMKLLIMSLGLKSVIASIVTIYLKIEKAKLKEPCY